jgi:hypothetical protein
VDIKYSEIVKGGLRMSYCDHFVLLKQRVRTAWLFSISLDPLTLRLTHGIDRLAAKPKHKFTSARPPEPPIDSNPKVPSRGRLTLTWAIPTAAGMEDIVPNRTDTTVDASWLHTTAVSEIVPEGARVMGVWCNMGCP